MQLPRECWQTEFGSSYLCISLQGFDGTFWLINNFKGALDKYYTVPQFSNKSVSKHFMKASLKFNAYIATFGICLVFSERK